ncbi:hypothetical protein ES332_A04G077200v1 [Gossypium tomentosum]|uniref:Uncharacterized protein n=1 Tax=Gossypium tomentosum TaxID=34277 RepID=A0A5D2QW81_GOSTO|nr:hypothetical protein ES332_A04G077200v1 [Gossypium tomentosum]
MVDPANTPLGKMLLEEITPVVMVLCTPLVEESCLKNGLSFVQMLSPFCDFTNIDVPVRTASDQPYRLHKFKLRLFYASDIWQPNLEVAKERLKQVITKAGEDDFPEISSDLPQVNDLLSRHESEILPTWFQFFNKELVRTLSFSDHEAFDHPVACLLVVSSCDEEPINRFLDLFNTIKLPSLLNDGAMDPKILKHYLLVHDNQDGASEKLARIFQLQLIEYIILPTICMHGDMKPSGKCKNLILHTPYFMLDQSRKEAEYCMEIAFNTYLKLGSPVQQNATRCGFWWIEMLKTRNQIKEAATVYFRICGEDLLHSAVMLEQASFCYLLSKPPMLHKYGFHLVLSGDHYKKCDQIKHAIRTYRNAVSVYRGTTWNLIKDRVHFHIGQWYASLGTYDVAVTHMLEILASSHQSKTSQELFLRDFLHIVQVLKLQLPVINISSLKVIFEDHRTYASPAAASIKEGVWCSLEEDMIPSLSAKSNWLDVQSKRIPRKYKESNICVAGEAIIVDIEFKNPLQIPISILSVSLICELSANPEELNSGKDINSSLVLSEVDFSLEGGETILVQLTVTPRVEGILTIVGVKWKLSSSVVGLHNFESNSVNKRIAKGRKAKHSPSADLKFVVIKSLPRLQGFIPSLPEKTYAGELRYLVLELNNQSKFPVKNLKMKISNPRFLNAGNQSYLNVEFPACLEKKLNVEQSGGHGNAKKMLQNVFHFPEDISVQEETSLSWPLWFHAAVPGHVSLYITVYYEMENVSSIMKFRTLRMHSNLQVLPSLDVSFELSPCPSRLEEFLLRMDVVNKTSSECFQIHQLSSVGQQWDFSLLQPVDSILPSQSLFAGQALSCFFMLKYHRKSSTSEDSNPVFLQSDVRFGPPGNSEALFDVCSSPLADFHGYERLYQGMSCQGNVDFVFITQLRRGNIDSGAPHRPLLFSHHVCHCSLSSFSSISWFVDGPQTIQHNFSASPCGVNLKMTINNSSDAASFVHIRTFDPRSSNSQSIDATASQSGLPMLLHFSNSQSIDATASQSGLPLENQAGWFSIPAVNDTKVITTDALAKRITNSVSLESAPQFIWTGSSSTKLKLQPRATAEIPLQICVFAPGIYDLSNYALNWNLAPIEESQGEANKSSGECQGYPYYLTVLQST